MPSSADMSSTSPLSVPSRPRKPMRMTPAKLRAQRANAQLSTGPRTVEGRRRSALNRRRLPLSSILSEHLRGLGADLAEVRRLWQDVLAVFWFVEPDCYAYLQWAAVCWWRKLDAMRAGRSRSCVESLDADIDQHLRRVLERFAKGHQRWDGWLRREIGEDGSQGIGRLRAAVEARLGTFRRKLGIETPSPPKKFRNEPKPVSHSLQ
jgi:hypothetical protein